jgi:hypothetical protein
VQELLMLYKPNYSVHNFEKAFKEQYFTNKKRTYFQVQWLDSEFLHL